MTPARRSGRTVAVIAPLRHPIAEPHAGGLESTVWDRVHTLRKRGHRVLLCAPKGSDFQDDADDALVLPLLEWAEPADASDTTYPPGYHAEALAALEGALDHLRSLAGSVDLIDNHSLEGLPLEWADRLGIPMVTTLHTPPLPGMLEAHAAHGRPGSRFVAVSGHTAAEWRAAGLETDVLPNAIDSERWHLGPGGPDLVWFGRIVPEKGPHLAIEAAVLTGRRLRLAGRVGDLDYFESSIAPMLGERIQYLGPLRQADLASLVGGSACALVTPMWDEPFGLVLAETMATGTPVAAFDTGGVAEVVGSSSAARLVPMGDAAALADAAEELASRWAANPARRLSTRASAVFRFSLNRRAIELERIHSRAVAERSGAATMPVVDA